MAKSNILLYGLGGLGVEIGKFHIADGSLGFFLSAKMPRRSLSLPTKNMPDIL
jgi:hypothetical protein